MDIDMDVYKDEFLQEINEYLEIFNQAFIDLENGDENALDEIFRVAHTIKGMAGFLGYTSLEKLCHKMEEVLSGIKCAEINIDSGLIDVMLETVDRINEMVEKIESQGTDDTEIQDLLESFEEYKQQGRSSTEDCAREEVSTDETVEESLDAVSSSASEDVEIIPEEEGKPKVSEGMQNDVDPLGEDCNIILDTKISNDADIKELKAVLVIESLKEEVEVIRTEPAEEEIDNTFKGKLKVFINGEAEKVQEVMEKISEIEMFEITEKGSEETKKDVAEPQLENVSEEYLASDEYNIILNTQISPSADIKELKAVLVIESMGEAGEVVRTEPAEEEIDGTFNGSLKVFIKGEADRVKDAMDRISEIESYEVIKCGPDVEYTSTDNETIKNESENYIQEKPTPQITKVSENSKETTHGYETDYKIIYESGPNNISLMSKIRDIIRNEKYSLQEKVKQLMAVFISNTQSSTDLAWEKRQYEKPRLMQPTPSEFNEDKEIQIEEEEKVTAQEIEKESQEVQEPQKAVERTSTENPKVKSENRKSIAQTDNTKKTGPGPKRQDSIKVRISDLDNIMNLVGELVINKGCLLQISHQHKIPELEEATGILDKSITSLQDEVMRMRMVKIERVFNKFPRMVRDLSKKFGKEINFEIEGQDTELDRTILDEISDPLVHLVRNSVDHGIEESQDREKAGKSQAGRIKLSARQEKSNVIIEIEDDGKGLDVENIKKKALEKEILSPSEIEKLDEDGIRMLIFTPSFSTKDNATEISGRGIGMDAVKNAVDKLGGNVRVYSTTGEGTRIKISLPPTVAIIRALVVEVANENYAIPISNVIEALNVNESNIKVIYDQPLLYVRDKLLPMIKLKEIFEIEENKPKSHKEIGIIVEKDNQEMAIIVDSIIDQQEIVIKPIGSVLSRVKGFNGVTILGDGKVIPIIDVSTLIGGNRDA
ncbi:chemotaxis protein CheA [Methanohalophilus sp. DAL1]|uniref:chemotaxis protein CheA n=1 Tax=Methanohalophilus sp. DAL1 TaxID=1864608 RepID=UPI000817CDB9|nr:chemotaxis protein CheA [Methanohalophilus sp. DAL1]OBZ35478.1 MAG: hypothetical protein A9957_06955 [Methanohalophilus sp. DAL1]